MEKLLEENHYVLEWYNSKCLGNQHDFRAQIKILKKRFNQSEGMYSCCCFQLLKHIFENNSSFSFPGSQNLHRHILYHFQMPTFFRGWMAVNGMLRLKTSMVSISMATMAMTSLYFTWRQWRGSLQHHRPSSPNMTGRETHIKVCFGRRPLPMTAFTS